MHKEQMFKYDNRLHEMEKCLEDEVFTHKTTVLKETRLCVMFFLNNESSICYKLKMQGVCINRSSVCDYLLREFPKTNIELLCRVLTRKGYLSRRKLCFGGSLILLLTTIKHYFFSKGVIQSDPWDSLDFKINKIGRFHKSKLFN